MELWVNPNTKTTFSRQHSPKMVEYVFVLFVFHFWTLNRQILNFEHVELVFREHLLQNGGQARKTPQKYFFSFIFGLLTYRYNIYQVRMEFWKLVWYFGAPKYFSPIPFLGDCSTILLVLRHILHCSLTASHHSYHLCRHWHGQRMESKYLLWDSTSPYHHHQMSSDVITIILIKLTMIEPSPSPPNHF